MSIFNLEKISSLILNSHNILIVSHYDPDGDALGSSIGLYKALNKLKKNCYVYNRDKIPDYLSFIKCSNLIDCLSKIPNDIDLIIYVDLNDFERAGSEIERYMLSFKNNIMVIDHHQNPKIDSKNTFIETSCSATAILIFKIIDHMQIDMDKELATNLLTGIITDTSSFKNSNTNSQSLDIASKLLDFGADLSLINSSIYNDKSIKRINLEKKILSNFLFDNNSKTGFSYCTLQDYEETNTTKEDSEGMANYFLHHMEVMIGIFVREIDDKSWKVSLRSNGYIDLSKLANTFGGGGHKNAAGFKYSGEIEDLRKDLNNKIINEK